MLSNQLAIQTVANVNTRHVIGIADLVLGIPLIHALAKRTVSCRCIRRLVVKRNVGDSRAGSIRTIRQKFLRLKRTERDAHGVDLAVKRVPPVRACDKPLFVMRAGAVSVCICKI